MKRLACILATVLAAAGLSGCAGNGYSPYYGFGGHQKAIAGTAMGAAGGALLGGALTQDGDGALVGGLLGAAAGGLVGHSMDKANRPQPYHDHDGAHEPDYRRSYRRSYYADHRRHDGGHDRRHSRRRDYD